MKFSIQQIDLKKNLSYLLKTIPTNPSLPILTSVYVELKNSKLTLAATDLFFGVKTTVMVNMEKEGVCVIPGKQFIELITSFSPQELFFEKKDNSLYITAGTNKTKIQLFNSADYPDFPQIAGNSFSLPVTHIEETYATVSYSASLDQARPALNAVLFSFEENNLETVSTDGFRLSTATFPLEQKIDAPFKLIIPLRSFAEIVRITKQVQDGTLVFTYSQEMQQLFCVCDSVVIYIRLVEGAFPPYKKILPTEFLSEFVLSGDELLSSLKKSVIFSRDASNIITFTFTPDHLTIEAKSPSLGTFENTLEYEKKELVEESLTVSFNSKYLLDFFSQIKPDKVWFGLNDSLKPVMLKSDNHRKLQYVVMPFKKTTS